MENITKLAYLLEITRKMPQYGYALSGGRGRMSNLAEHQYLVTMIAWQIARALKEKGADIDVLTTLEFALLHDIGELFGGDISMPYAAANKEAYDKAKAFEAENHAFLSQFFVDDEDTADVLDEILDADSDEARVAKVADYIECTIYKQYIGEFTEADIELIEEKLPEKIDGISDEIAREALTDFVQSWVDDTEDFSSFDEKIKEILNSTT